MTCNSPLLKSLWLNYIHTFELYEPPFSHSQTASRHALPSFHEITADLNYSELQTFHFSGWSENSFVQPTSPQTESVFIIQRRRSSGEIRAAEKRLPVWILGSVWKMCLGGMWNTHKWISASCFANCVYSDETLWCFPTRRILGVSRVCGWFGIFFLGIHTDIVKSRLPKQVTRYHFSSFHFWTYISMTLLMLPEEDSQAWNLRGCHSKSFLC